MTATSNVVTGLSDQQLQDALKLLADRDRALQVELLWHLAEFDRRRLYLGKGYPSMWEYCRRELKFSEGAAGRRLVSARKLVLLPKAAEYLRDGWISGCAFAVLAPKLTESNADELLGKACGLSKRETEDLVAVLEAQPIASARRDVIRVVAKRAPLVMNEPADGSPTLAARAGNDGKSQAAVLELVHRVAFDADEEIVAQLKRLQELLGERELKEVVRRANAALLDKVDPVRRDARRVDKSTRKSAKKPPRVGGEKPNVKSTVKHRQPIAVRDAVAVRDGGQCTFVSRDGVRCTARRHLHVDHVRPFALGGSSVDLENNRVMCAAHNLWRARQTFGDRCSR
jgi:hypothetical protein